MALDDGDGPAGRAAGLVQRRVALGLDVRVAVLTLRVGLKAGTYFWKKRVRVRKRSLARCRRVRQEDEAESGHVSHGQSVTHPRLPVDSLPEGLNCHHLGH